MILFPGLNQATALTWRCFQGEVIEGFDTEILLMLAAKVSSSENLLTKLSPPPSPTYPFNLPFQELTTQAGSSA